MLNFVPVHCAHISLVIRRKSTSTGWLKFGLPIWPCKAASCTGFSPRLLDFQRSAWYSFSICRHSICPDDAAQWPGLQTSQSSMNRTHFERRAPSKFPLKWRVRYHSIEFVVTLPRPTHWHPEFVTALSVLIIWIFNKIFSNDSFRNIT